MSTRAERRAAARETAKLLLRQPPPKKGFRWDYTLAFGAAMMVVLIVFFPPENATTALFWLAALFALGVYPALHFAATALPDKKSVAYPLALLGLASIVSTIGIYKWPQSPYYRKIDAKETKLFSGLISNPPSGAELIRLGCPQANEDLCIMVGQFLPLFQRAGWKVEGDQIQRLILPKPISGVVIFRHGEGTPVPSNPDLGLWILQSPGLLQVVKAFRSLNMLPQQAADANMPNGVLGIYFGPAP